MISILIANYNNSYFFLEALESVYNQEVLHFEMEIIVCDDCSTDGSAEIAKKLQPQYNYILLQNEKNLGVGATKARLVEASKGDWFIFLDGDDKLKQDCLKKLWSRINELKNENLSLLYANSIKLEENGTLTEWSRSKSYQGSLLENKFEYPIFHPVIYNRKKYNLTEGINIHLKSADDFDLWYKMEEVGTVEFINEPLYYYRINLNGVSQIGDNTQKWVQVILEHAYCTANAAERRGLDIRFEFNEFAEIIMKKLICKKSTSTIYKRIIKKGRNYFKMNL